MTARWLFFVDRGFDADVYKDRYSRGLEPDRYPYGAEHIPEAAVAFGRPTSGERSLLLAHRLGFDLLHAWRNRRAIRSADVVYCHTEEQYLGAALMLLLGGRRRRRRVTLVGQTIWLYEHEGRRARLLRKLYRPLLARVDLFVYNALPNHDHARKVLPRGRHTYLPFGVSSIFGDSPAPTERERLVVSIGNDPSRDWATLGAAARTIDASLRVATGIAPAEIDRERVRPTSSMEELIGLYRRAAVVVVPTVDNLHASGITSILEAAAVGTPIVATRTGGLDAYFSDEEIRFVEQRDPQALADAVNDVLDSDDVEAMAERLRDKSRAAGYTNAAYWRRVSDALTTLER